MTIKIQHFNEFILLSELLNFSKTAQKMNVTQPVLSRHMKYLEEQFNVELLKRDTHKVELTAAGDFFLDEARKIILQYESSLSEVHSFTGRSEHRLAITFLGDAIRKFLISFLTTFSHNHADITVESRDSELDEALSLLDNHTCDFGFLIRPSFVVNKTKFSTLPFQTDPLCAVVNKQHPLASHESASLREISKWPIIRVDPREFALSNEYSTQFFTCHNIEYHILKEYQNLKTCCFNLEFNDQAVLLMPKHRQYLVGDNCVLLKVAEEDCWFNLELVWDNKNINSQMRVFLKEFKSYIK
jgi:DNA-binding transcriptional LysR family regulator